MNHNKVSTLSYLERPILSGWVDFPMSLAPMVGLSHVVMREMLRSYLPEGAQTLWPTEMLNSRKLPHQKLGETPQTLKGTNEDGLVPQILGNEADPLEKSIFALKNWGAKAIDINMGCPVKKALKHNYGVALMGDAKYAANVVHMAAVSSDLPVSVKLRAGQQQDLKFLEKFCHGLVEAGAEWICLHPRLASEKRRGKADWSQIKWLRSKLKIPVIGNGDLQSIEDVLSALSGDFCDSVMVGRAFTARPWLFWQLGERLGLRPPLGREGSAPGTPEEEGAEYGKMLRAILPRFYKSFSEELAYRKFLFFVKNGAPWLEFGHALTARISGVSQQDEIDQRLEYFFRQPQKMYKKTDLRY